MSNYIIPDNFLVQDDHKTVASRVHPIDLTSCRVHDALATNLPATAATDDLALITGTPGTSAPELQGLDFGGTSTTAYATFSFAVPGNYRDGEAFSIVMKNAGMLTTISDGTATVDLSVWSDDFDGTLSADLVSTAATTLNSLTLADVTFALTATTLAKGQLLHCRIKVAGTDSGNAGVMIPTISAVQVLCDTRG